MSDDKSVQPSNSDFVDRSFSSSSEKKGSCSTSGEATGTNSSVISITRQGGTQSKGDESAKARASDSYDNSGCFAADGVVRMADGQQRTMSELSVGDQIQAVDLTSGEPIVDTVVAFLTRDAHGTSNFMTIKTKSGRAQTLTPTHLIYSTDSPSAQGSMMFAQDVHVGDYVWEVPESGELRLSKIVSVELDQRRSGIYSPLTRSGTVVVDGVVSSCYARFGNHRLADLAMAPLKYWYDVRSVLGLQLDGPSLCPDQGGHWYPEVIKAVGLRALPSNWWF